MRAALMIVLSSSAIAVACGAFGTSDATAPDSGTTPPQPEGGTTTNDATIDTGADATSDVFVPCTPRPVLKDDFDRIGTPVEQGWTKKDVGGGGTLTPSTNPAINGAASLRAAFQATGTGTAHLEKNLDESTCPLKIGLVFSPTSNYPTEKASLVSVRYPTGDIELRVEGKRLVLREDPDADAGSSTQIDLVTDLVIDARYAITLNVDTVKKSVGYTLASPPTAINGALGVPTQYGAPTAVWIGAEDVKTSG